MKYSEFKNQVNTDIYNISETGVYIFVLNYKGFTLTTVSKKDAYIMSSNSIAFENLKADERLRLLDLAMALAITPLAEREEEKKYNVVFPNIRRSGLPIILIKVNWDGSGYTTMDWPCESYIEKHSEQFAFTEQEIKDIDERYLAFKVEVSE